MRPRDELDGGYFAGGEAGSSRVSDVRAKHELVDGELDGPEVDPQYQSLYDEVQRYKAVLQKRFDAFLVTDDSDKKQICEAKLAVCRAVLSGLKVRRYDVIFNTILRYDKVGWNAGIRSNVARFVREAQKLLPVYVSAEAGVHARSARATVAPEKGTLANKVEAHAKRIFSRMNMPMREHFYTDQEIPTSEQLTILPRLSQKPFAILRAKACVLKVVYKLLTCGENQNAIDKLRQQLETECDKPAHEGLWDKGIHSKVAGFVKEAKVLCPTRKELELVRDSKGGTPMHAGW